MPLCPRLIPGIAIAIFAFAHLATGCGETPQPPPLPKTKLFIRVIDAVTENPIENADVLLIEDGKTRHTDASGRIDASEVKPGAYHYRAQAAGHIAVPRLVHRARAQVITATTTSFTIKLEPRPGPMGSAVLAGAVTKGGAPVAGTLVVAVSAQSYATYSDGAGKYQIAGVAPGLYQLKAYLARHANVGGGRANVQINGTETKSDLGLELMDDAGATVTGQMAGSGRTGTSTVTLIEDNTGAVVPGLSTRADFGGQYSIPGVPKGTFQIKAALEDDGITFDAQWLLDNGQPAVTVDGPSPKTVDLKFNSDGMRSIMPASTSTVPAPVVFRWQAVQGADFYVVEVRDLIGGVLWGGFDARRQARDPIPGTMTMVSFGGPQPLAGGTLYFWRVFAAKTVTTGQQFNLLAMSEEIGGEFRVVR